MRIGKNGKVAQLRKLMEATASTRLASRCFAVPSDDSNELRLALGTRIRAARHAADLSSEQVGEACGVSQQSVRSWETGRHEPTAGSLLQLAILFNVTTDYLLGRPPKRGPLFIMDSALYRDQLRSTSASDDCWSRGKPFFDLDEHLRVVDDRQRLKAFDELNTKWSSLSSPD